MSGAPSRTCWQDQRVAPDDYEDVPGLVKLAKRAMWQLVEFDWSFSRDDLEHLRRAVYEWGSQNRGSYRRFDARLLTAINAALGAEDTVFGLSAPSGEGWMPCEVSCVADGDGFRLQGRAAFGIVFGYGEAAVQESGPGRALLGLAVRATLADSVGQLGWDLRRLQDRNLMAVRNAIYGRALAAGVQERPEPRGPEVRVELNFRGPFAAGDNVECPCLFTEDIARQRGIYLWTIEVEGDARPWYVGQTRRTFGRRMSEHVTKMLAGEYTPHDPQALSCGDSGTLCKGLGTLSWPFTIPVLLRNWEALAPEIMAVIRLVRFHVAPLEAEPHLFDRVEGAIGRYYQSHPSPELSTFITPGLRLPVAIPGDRPLRLAVTSEAPVEGLPAEILEPPAGSMATFKPKCW